jgi:alpha-L-fucosidase
MKVNNEAIYATTASPFKHLPWGRCTKKLTSSEAVLYLHVFEWPADSKLLVPGLRNKVESAYLLTDKRHPLSAQEDPEGVTLLLPPTAPDAVSSTIVLRIKGALKIDQPVLSQAADGTLLLPASEARLHGDQIRYESGHQRDNLGFWFDPADWAEWDFKVSKPGRFEVSAEVAAPDSASLEIQLNDQKLKGKSPITGDYGKFEWTQLGQLQIQSAGKLTLSLHGVQDGWHPVNVKSIQLKPIASGQ